MDKRRGNKMEVVALIVSGITVVSAFVTLTINFYRTSNFLAQHPTREEVTQMITTALKPVDVKIDAVKESVDHIRKWVDDQIKLKRK
jgi:hypothetical protein